MVEVFVVNNDLKNMEFSEEADYIVSVSIYKKLDMKLKGKDIKTLMNLYNDNFNGYSSQHQNFMVEKILKHHLTERLENFIEEIDLEKIIKESL